jgi:NADH-quinone oxidoreductase subunit N
MAVQFCPQPVPCPSLSGVAFPVCCDGLFTTSPFLGGYPPLPELFLSLALLGLLLYGVLCSTLPRQAFEKGGTSCQGLAKPCAVRQGFPLVLGPVTGLALLSLLLGILLLWQAPITQASVLFHSLALDPVSQWLKMGVLTTAGLCLLLGLPSLAREGLQAFEGPLLLLTATLGLVVLLSAQDFPTLYLALELQSLSFYVVAALKRRSEFATEAGLKYFLLGAFASGLLLFGCALLYGLTGTTHLVELGLLLAGTGAQASPGVVLGMLLLFAGLFFKLAAAPFHMWAPDVYEGAPTAITVYFMSVPKLALGVLWVRLAYGTFFDLLAQWQPLVILVSGLSLLVGAFGGLAQGALKRLLAYSGIGHTGFLLAAGACGTLEGVQALLVYLVIYVVMTLGVFALLLGSPRGARRRFLQDLRALGGTDPAVAAGLTVLLFSLAGIPPLAGFYTKALVIEATLGASLMPLAVLSVLTSVVSCFYYIRLVRLMYFEAPGRWCAVEALPAAHAYVLSGSVLTMLTFLLYPGPLLHLAHRLSLVLTL